MNKWQQKYVFTIKEDLNLTKTTGTEKINASISLSQASKQNQTSENFFKSITDLFFGQYLKTTARTT
jgi:hypothetical protein